MAFCDKAYLPKAILPDEGTNDWVKLVGLCDPKVREYLPWEIEDETLFELDVSDIHDVEGVIKIIENSLDHTGGLHQLAIMVNSGYETNSFLSSSIHSNDVQFSSWSRGYLWRK